MNTELLNKILNSLKSRRILVSKEDDYRELIMTLYDLGVLFFSIHGNIHNTLEDTKELIGRYIHTDGVYMEYGVELGIDYMGWHLTRVYTDYSNDYDCSFSDLKNAIAKYTMATPSSFKRPKIKGD